MNLKQFKLAEEAAAKIGELLKTEFKLAEDHYVFTKNGFETRLYPFKNVESNVAGQCVILSDGSYSTNNCRSIDLDTIEQLSSLDQNGLQMFSIWFFGMPFKLPQKPSIPSNGYKIIKKSSSLEKREFPCTLNNLVKQALVYDNEKKCYRTEDGLSSYILLVSKEYERSSWNYWYSYHPYQRAILKEAKTNGFLVLSFKNNGDLIVLPRDYLEEKLPLLGHSGEGTKLYWHINVKKSFRGYELRIPNKGLESLSQFVIKAGNPEMEKSVIRISGGMRSIKK